MPSNKRPRRLNYAVNKKGPITGGKVTQSITHYQALQKRLAFEGETKWLQNAVAIVMVKLKKYGINPNKI